MTRTLLPLVAIGGGLAITPAAALELGELTVESRLGQPLRASIAYALAPNEMLSDTCVSVGGGRSTSSLPGVGPNTIRITDSAILITGETPVREPMLSTRVTINCPYTPNLSREYMLFVDPADPAPVSLAPVAEAAAEPAARAPTATKAVIRTTPTPNNDTSPIYESTRYQVQPGDSLSGIASRIRNRSVSLWPAVNAIFDANPDAFIDDDPNRLKAGSWLTIPSFDGVAPVVAAAAVSEPRVAPALLEPMEAVAGAVYEPPVIEDIIDPEAAVEATGEAAEAAPELRPGDVIVVNENPAVEPTVAPAETVTIPDTVLPGPATTSTSPDVPTAIVSTGSRSESAALYAWLIGGGLAIFAGLLLFGRRIRERFEPSPIAAGAATAPVLDDVETAEAEPDYDIDDDSPTEENLALDADLVLGTGLEEGTDMEVANDFGFASMTELDIELPFEPEEPVTDSWTDVIPPLSPAKLETILESEVLPEDDDYDMSVMVDATQMPQPEDVTERDLMAVPVQPSDETLISDNYTISKEVDYDILEQDYEDELTATQALNEEISRAAAELAQDLEDSGNDVDTAETPLASVTELDITAQMPEADVTAEMEQALDPNDTAAVTVNLPTDDKTAEMPVANDDDTAEMEVSGGKLDSGNR